MFGFLCAVIMGFTLGLLGGGGSILSVPIFIYVYSYSPIEATSLSLFVVSLTAFIGFLRHLKAGNVEVKQGLLFAIPSLISVFAVRYFIIPALPDVILNLQGFSLTKDLLVLLSFAGVMLYAGFKMIKGRKEIKLENTKDVSVLNFILKGSFIGAVTGFVGAGGGFLIVPTLHLMFKMPIRVAMGTSLMVIALNSSIGFISSSRLLSTIPWSFLLGFSVFSVFGLFIGIFMNSRTDPKKLKKIFGVFVILMAVFIIFKR